MYLCILFSTVDTYWFYSERKRCLKRIIFFKGGLFIAAESEPVVAWDTGRGQFFTADGQEGTF